MAYPLTMFCCGCSVPAGTTIILLFHLVACFGILASVCSNLIFHNPVFASTWSVQAQFLYMGFALMGIPIIVSALWGVANQVETNIRVYLYYLMCSFLENAVALVYFCLVEDVCRLAGTLVEVGTSNFGEAFLCGTFRTVSYFTVATGIAVEVYCLWVIWSFCEDVHDGKNGLELWQLIPSKDDMIQRSKSNKEGPYADIVGFAHTGLPGPYGTVSTDAATIFGGGYHDTAYPPRGPDDF
mmetsp:Transcript_132373/g.423616  ORF Transcript_132373/g.423616 Transcript_132373/m.423616 type:complete len:240 (+) Transcript_132373:93-812(+)